MFFWFKKKTIVVDAFTFSQLVHTQYPIARATKFVPNWWKRLPQTVPALGHEYAPEATSKYCQGFIDLYSRGFMLPLWSDVSIELVHTGSERKWRYMFADRKSVLDYHDYRSIEGMLSEEKYQHFKFPAPWVFRSKHETKFLMTQPVWSMGDNINKITMLPGVIDFKYQFSANVNVFLEYIPNTTRNIVLEAGEPLSHIIPLTEDSVDIRCHEVSMDEFNRKNHPISKFKGNYKERKLRLNNNEPSKCPFKRWH